MPPLSNRTGRICWGLAVLAGLFAGPAWAQNSADMNRKLRSVERKIVTQTRESTRQNVRAKTLKTELNAVTQKLITAARRVQGREAQVAMLEGELSRVEREAEVKTQKLRARRQQFSGVMMALSRLARFPTEALIVQPISPQDTVRTAILLRAAIPALEKRAKALKVELETLSRTRAQVEKQRLELRGAVERLRAEEAGIEAIRKKKAALRAEAISKSRAASTQVNRLARKARNLRDLVARLDRERKKAETEARAKARAASVLYVRPKVRSRGSQSAQPGVRDLGVLGKMGSIIKARGRLPFPVMGRLVGLYGQPLDGKTTRKGLSIETLDNAQVVAPFDGKVVFSGPFRGYGQLLIIDHGEGYHSLLAGLGRIDVVLGQVVLAGEPVAVMPGGALSGSGAGEGHDGGRSVLYVEFRRNNQPINPLPWLVSRKGTPKG